MIRILAYLIIILIGLCISPYLVGSTGYVYIAAGEYQIETSLVFATIALIVFFSLLQVAEWVIVFTINLILNSRYLPERWRKKAAKKNTLLGALSLAEEDWPTAEKAMLKGAAKGELPALNLLAAARAAQHQENIEARDQYLAEAEKDPAAVSAVTTTRSRYLLQQGNAEAARVELDKLNPTSKSKLPVLRLAIDIYQAQQDWQALKHLLPVIKKRNVLDDDGFLALVETTNLALIDKAAQDSEEELEKVWQWLSRAERGQSRYIAAYAQGLSVCGKKDEAIKLLLKKLKGSPDKALFAAFPKILTPEDTEVIDKLKAKSDSLKENSEYHLCMAHLYQGQKAYNEAKESWLKVCEQNPTRDFWLALADVQEQLGEHFSAIQSYRNAAHL